jgi:hypothetical protein
MARATVILVIFLGACDVGSVTNINNQVVDGNGGGGDTGGGGDGSQGANCENLTTPNGDGHHNAANACIVAGCHLEGQTGAGAPAYSYGGTVYKDAAGTQPYAGATILITMGGTTHKLISATNGNFFYTPALLPSPTNANTANAAASVCPDKTAMTGALVQGGGNCNNCHKTAGGQAPPIHIP